MIEWQNSTAALTNIANTSKHNVRCGNDKTARQERRGGDRVRGNTGGGSNGDEGEATRRRAGEGETARAGRGSEGGEGGAGAGCDGGDGGRAVRW